MKKLALAEAEWISWVISMWADKIRSQVSSQAPEWEPVRLAVHLGTLFWDVVIAPVVTHNPFFPTRAVEEAGEGAPSAVTASPRGRGSRLRSRWGRFPC